MKILVTGANGYIGSKLVKTLCDKGVDVIATDIDSSRIDKRAHFIKSNIFEEKANWFEYFGNPDICLHMAWRDGFVHDSSKHIGDLSAHFLFVKNLIDNGLPKIVSMGSMHEVGYWEGSVDENTPCIPMSQYGVAKNALRKALELYAAQKNCKFQWLRCFYIYGDDEYGNSIFCKIRQAVKNGATSFPFTTGSNKYDFIHIDSLVEQLACSVLQDDILGIINCCSGKAVSLAEQVEWYIKSNNLPIKLEYGKYPNRPYDSPVIYGNSDRINAIMKRSKTTVLVTGVAGQLGHDVINELNKRGIIAIGTDVIAENDIKNRSNWFAYHKLDITDERALTDAVEAIHPNIIIHCAAWTNVDGAENIENRKIVEKINVGGTKNLATIANNIGAKFVYISTDYVFDGNGEEPWKPDNTHYSPLNFYGKTKLQGELAVSSILKEYFIVRIAWAFGLNGNNFIKTMLSLADKGYKELKVVDDQVGTPTYTYDLARLLVDMVETDKYGYYHATNEGGYISWADFAEEIFRQAGKDVKVNRVSTAEYGASIAKRPFNSRLDKSKLSDNGFVRLPNWKDALHRYLIDIKKTSSSSLISIIIPVYNCGNYLKRCIDSVLKQTYKNIEVILVDDGSSDNSGEICDEYSNKHPNTVKVIHQTNSGQASARNNGVKLAKGGFVSFVDGDDWVDPSFIETLYRNAVEAKADISCCGIQKENSKHRFYTFNPDTSYFQIYEKEEALRELLNNRIITSSPCDKLYKASIVKESPMTEGIIYEDYEVMPKWISKSTKIAYTGQPLYYYAFNVSGTTRLKNPRILEQITASDNRVSFYKNYFPSLYEDAFAESLFTKVGILQRTTFIKGKKKERKELRQAILQAYKSVDRKKISKGTKAKVLIIKTGLFSFDFLNILYYIIRRMMFFR